MTNVGTAERAGRPTVPNQHSTTSPPPGGYNGAMAKPFQFQLRTLLLAVLPAAVVALPVGWYLRTPRSVLVSGSVTLDGMPFDAYVLFRPVTLMKTVPPIKGTNAAGNFRLRAMPGSYTVQIWNEAPKGNGDISMSGLEVEVTRDGPNVFNFNLRSPYMA